MITLVYFPPLQIVLQDHNYGAPPPSYLQMHNNDSPSHGVQCKQEPPDSHSTSIVTVSQRGGIKTLTPRPAAVSPQGGRQPAATKPNNGVTLTKRQRTSSGNSNGMAVKANVTPPSQVGSRRPATQHGCETPKSSGHNSLPTPPLVPKGAPGFPYAGDLNSHLYASISSEKGSGGGGGGAAVKEEPRASAVTANGSSGLSNYFGGWYHGSGNNAERMRSRSDLRDSFNDDDSNDGSLDHSPRTANETDHEGEETETANECEDEEDEQDDLDLLGGREINSIDESVTRCIW